MSPTFCNAMMAHDLIGLGIPYPPFFFHFLFYFFWATHKSCLPRRLTWLARVQTTCPRTRTKGVADQTQLPPFQILMFSEPLKNKSDVSDSLSDVSESISDVSANSEVMLRYEVMFRIL
jgi:hypothetical protein